MHREKLGGCLRSSGAGRHSPRGYIAKYRLCIPCVPTTHATSLSVSPITGDPIHDARDQRDSEGIG
eukprot:1268503-Prymnesium_polylepis.1